MDSWTPVTKVEPDPTRKTACKPFRVRKPGVHKRHRLGTGVAQWKAAVSRSSEPINDDGRAAWLEQLLQSEVPEEEARDSQVGRGLLAWSADHHVCRLTAKPQSSILSVVRSLCLRS